MRFLDLEFAHSVTKMPANSRSSALDALSVWLDHLANERRASPRTVEAYGDAVRRYLTFLTRHRGEALSLQDLGTVSAAEVRAYLAVRRQGPRPLEERR